MIRTALAVALTVALAACSSPSTETAPPQAAVPAATPEVAAPVNALLTASPLPMQAPPFDKITDADYQPAIEEGMRQQLAEIEGALYEEEGQVEGAEQIGAQAEQALLGPVVIELGRRCPQPQIDLLGLGLFSDRGQGHFTEMFKTGEVLRIPFLHANSSLVVSKRVYRQSLAIN